MDAATATIPKLDSLLCFIYLWPVYLHCFLIFIFGSFFVLFLFYFYYVIQLFLFYPDTLLLAWYQIEQMSKMCVLHCFSHQWRQRTHFHIFIIELFFSDSLLGFTYLVLYGFIVEVIVLLAVYYGFAKFQGIIL